MRPIALLIASMLVATSAGARPTGHHAIVPPQLPRQVDLSAGDTLRPEIRMEDVDVPLLHAAAPPSQSARTVALPHLEIGALTPELSRGSEGPPQVGRYKLEGAATLGSSISGSVDRHGAELNFVWPLSQ
jgi:hypothetical protein